MYLLNAFSLQMMADLPATIKASEVSYDESSRHFRLLGNADSCPQHGIGTVYYDTLLKGIDGMTSAIGHADTAAVLGVPMNRVNVVLRKGDKAIVAQLQGGRLPEGSKTLPEGFSFKFLLVEVV